MKVQFNVKDIANLARALTIYGELFVTSDAQMFRKETDTKEAVRTKNMIIDEPDNYVGYLKMSIEDVTPVKLRGYAKDLQTFEDLFLKATIPPSRDKQKPFEKEFEKPQTVDEAKEAEILKALYGDVPAADKAAADKAAADKAAADKAAAKLI